METQQIEFIAIELLDPHPNNPRGPIDPESVAELADSIREKGIAEPLSVVPIRDPGQPGKIVRYRVVLGHRRRAGAKVAGLTEVPAIIRDWSDDEQEEMMLVENIQRKDLTPLQEAKAYQRRVASGATLADVARRIGVSPGRVQQHMTILKLSGPVQRLFDGKDMPITAAPLLSKISSPDRQERLAQMIASRRLTVPRLKEMIAKEEDAAETARAVDKSRAKEKDPDGEAQTTGEIYTRKNAVADLERLNSASLQYSNILEAMTDVCGNCGMSARESICAACPLPQLINNLTNRSGNATA